MFGAQVRSYRRKAIVTGSAAGTARETSAPLHYQHIYEVHVPLENIYSTYDI